MTINIPLGNYNKYVGYVLAWVLKRYLPKGSRLWLRGRKPRTPWGYRHSVPLNESRRVAIYLVYRLHDSIKGFTYTTTPAGKEGA